MCTCVVIFSFPLHFPLFRAVLLLFGENPKPTLSCFPIFQAAQSRSNTPKMGGLGCFRGTFPPALYSTISAPFVLGPRSCFGAQSYPNPALRIADRLSTSKLWRHKTQPRDPDLHSLYADFFKKRRKKLNLTRSFLWGWRRLFSNCVFTKALLFLIGPEMLGPNV